MEFKIVAVLKKDEIESQEIRNVINKKEVFKLVSKEMPLEFRIPKILANKALLKEGDEIIIDVLIREKDKSSLKEKVDTIKKNQISIFNEEGEDKSLMEEDRVSLAFPIGINRKIINPEMGEINNIDKNPLSEITENKESRNSSEIIANNRDSNIESTEKRKYESENVINKENEKENMEIDNTNNKKINSKIRDDDIKEFIEKLRELKEKLAHL